MKKTILIALLTGGLATGAASIAANKNEIIQLSSLENTGVVPVIGSDMEKDIQELGESESKTVGKINCGPFCNDPSCLKNCIVPINLPDGSTN